MPPDANQAANDISPANNLTGTHLGKWVVGEKVSKKPGQTGRCFSVVYSATNDRGDTGFVKAIDLIDCLSDPEELRHQLNNYEYEARVLELCRDLKMDGVVSALQSGIHKTHIAGFEVAVPYLVFERADADLRGHDNVSDLNLAWRLTVFHGVCVAMRQLHRAEVAHQDLKPSNVLIFSHSKAKIADLGRATMRSKPSNFNGWSHQGDNNYVPIELKYDGYHTTSWIRRRVGADFFMMGCLLVYLLVDASLLTLLLERLDRRFWPKPGGITFSEALPHLELSFEAVLLDIKKELPVSVADEILIMIGVLAHPNPERRGRPYLLGSMWQDTKTKDPEDSLKQQYSLEHIVSRFDALAKAAKLGSRLNKSDFLKFFRTTK